MTAKFKVGDVVELKSGGPAMTITDGPNGTENHYWTTWFKGASKEKGNFPEGALNAYEPPKK